MKRFLAWLRRIWADDPVTLTHWSGGFERGQIVLINGKSYRIRSIVSQTSCLFGPARFWERWCAAMQQKIWEIENYSSHYEGELICRNDF